MAKTSKIIQLAKTASQSHATAFQPSKSTALYLLELRTHHAAAKTPLPRRRLMVTVLPEQALYNIAQTIKISRA